MRRFVDRLAFVYLKINGENEQGFRGAENMMRERPSCVGWCSKNGIVLVDQGREVPGDFRCVSLTSWSGSLVDSVFAI